ncbi:hypothetical protein JOS77_17850 [Chromobacterium haemolyticum]|nr:hypothetical protein JOS77_17850 [Chromobacterium haemolyticum]
MPKPAAKQAASAPAVSLTDKLAEAQQALDQLETIKLDKLPAGVTPGELLFRRALLERLVASYAWQLDLAGERDQRLRQQAEAEEALRNWSGFTQAGPYPVSLVEGLRSRLQTGGWEKETQQAQQQLMLSQMQEAMRNSLKLNEVSLRQAREQLEGAAAGEERPRRCAGRWTAHVGVATSARRSCCSSMPWDRCCASASKHCRRSWRFGASNWTASANRYAFSRPSWTGCNGGWERNACDWSGKWERMSSAAAGPRPSWRSWRGSWPR